MSNVKVSIIVPVYNIPENILRKCVESTIHQTMKEIEIILVDDGSTNNSGLICDEYSSKDKRIRVIHKENGGLSAARNTGFENATGDWITFLDSDDWIDEHTCEDTYKLGVESNSDVVLFGTIQEFEHYKNPFKYHYKDGQIFQGSQCKELQCEILNFTGNIATAWAKLFRRNFLVDNGLEHNAELRQGSEGIEFNIRVFEKVTRAYFTDRIYYHYIFNPNSISAKHDEKNHYFVIMCFEEIQREIKDSSNRQMLERYLFNRFAYVIAATAVSGYFSPLNKQSYRDKKNSFIQYLENDFVKKTLNNYERAQIKLSRIIILWAIKKRLFFFIQLLAELRYIQKHKG